MISIPIGEQVAALGEGCSRQADGDTKEYRKETVGKREQAAERRKRPWAPQQTAGRSGKHPAERKQLSRPWHTQPTEYHAAFNMIIMETM